MRHAKKQRLTEKYSEFFNQRKILPQSGKNSALPVAFFPVFCYNKSNHPFVERSLIMADTKQYDIHLLSNSHWDREWYMSHEQYLARLVPLMDRLVDIMKTQPEYIFVMDGQ